MKDIIEKRLTVLIGKRLSRRTRTLNLESLQFGSLRKIDGREVGEQAIHISCPWRVVGKFLYAGSKDIDFDKEGRYDSNIDWDNQTYIDILMRELLNRNELVVQNIVADDFGGCEIHFENGIRLQIIPTSGAREPSNEYWRIFAPGDETDQHFVVTSRGVS